MNDKKIKILIVAGTHGDEKIGEKVYKKLSMNKTLPGVYFRIANKRAYKKNLRYIDSDLNRVFPGKKNGNHEERLALRFTELVLSMDIVIDIHSTKSELKDAIIITKMDHKTKEYLDVINPRKVLLMNISKKNALISCAKIGLAFEYGKDGDEKVVSKIVSDIKKLLIYLGKIDGKLSFSKRKTHYYSVDRSISKPSKFSLLPNIKNYSIVKKGQVYARFENQKIIAKYDFYPILFGNYNYEKIFGFAGKKIYPR